MKSNWNWFVPAVLLGMLLFGAVFAPWVVTQNPYDQGALRLEDSARPPDWFRGEGRGNAGEANQIKTRYLLGTDLQGRDVLSAVLYGLRVSLLVGCVGTLLALIGGVALGMLAGYWCGWLDAIIMRLADIQLAFPAMLLALFMMALWGPGLGKIIVAVAAVHWVIYARLVRGSVLVEREKDYVMAIRALGAWAPRIMLRHILPNLLGPVLVVSMVEFASIIMLEATLSFLGIGVPITRPSLGMLIKFGYDDFFSGCWWIWLFPGLALVMLVLSLNWLFDALRGRIQT